MLLVKAIHGEKKRTCEQSSNNNLAFWMCHVNGFPPQVSLMYQAYSFMLQLQFNEPSKYNVRNNCYQGTYLLY